MIWPERPYGHTPDITGRPDEPWWTRDAIEWMDCHITRDMSVIEWGAGASTPWLLKRAASVITVEHDADWVKLVEGAIGVPITEKPLGFNYIGIKARDMDVAIVDGRLRVFCCYEAARILKPGGILLLDNAERPEYQEVHELLIEWPVIQTDNGIWRTDIWIKPKS